MKLAFDMSSYLKTGLLVGEDRKDGQLVLFEDKEVLVNSAEYGYENVINMMVSALNATGLKPIDCLLVFEGMNSKSRRLLIDNGYKGKRDKRPPQFYEEFNRLKEYIEKVWKDLGAIAMSQDFVEADDVLAFLAKHTEEDLVISSRDNDLGALIGVNEYGATVRFHNGEQFDMIKANSELFVHPPKYLTLFKALVGDSSDSISGVKGFGPAKFQKLLEDYGYDGADELMGLLDLGNLSPLHDMAAERHGKGKDKDKPVHPLVKMIVDNEADAIKGWKLAKMYPEWVTFHRPSVKKHLEFRPGKHEAPPADADQRLAQWYGFQYLVTQENYDDAVQMLRDFIMFSPDVDFDIESSAPEESDEWMAALGDPNGVDQLGHELTGFSITFGDNKQHTFYVSVDHKDTANITKKQARLLLEIIFDAQKEVVIQNNFFELPVVGQTCDEDGTSWMSIWAQKYPEYRGFIPRSLDTKIEAAYVNENVERGLKFRSKYHLGYDQATFEQTTRKTGRLDQLPAGGRVVEVLEWQRRCRSCGAVGFEESKKHGCCTFCDGTEGGVEITKAEIKEWNATHPEVQVFDKEPLVVVKQYKMKELTADEVFSYGCDDTICTGALHRYYKLIMQLEHQWQVYLDTEIEASYQHAKNFLDGMPVSIEKCRQLDQHDTQTYNRAWATVRDFLIANGWEGTVPPMYEQAITAAQIKEAYIIVAQGASNGKIEIEDLGGLEEVSEDDETGVVAVSDGEEGAESEASKDPFLASRVRTPAKLAILARELGHEMFAGMVEQCLEGQHEKFTSWVREHFSGEPLFTGSNKQMCKLLYEVMKLPIRVRNKPTEKMRKEGKDGNPKGDALALAYALKECTEEQKAVLEALKLMQMVKTRRSFYYSKYPYFVHWKTGRVHTTHNQCHTNTRRASESKPNKQQLPKHPKVTGEPSRFREVIVPHHPDAVIVSLDFDSQELRVIADYSQDENMVACYVGDNKKDMHALTGHQIAVKKKAIPEAVDVAMFTYAAKNKEHELYKVCAEYRALGKKVNFTTEFGAMAPKLAMTMLVPESEEQTYIDAKEAMFPGVRKWKNAVIEESKREGIVRTKGGAVRHLAFAYMGEDYWLKSKAERQAVNFKVQSSSAEMTKRAEGRMWRMGLVYKYDAICYGPIHDEVVFSVMKKDLVAFLKDAHWCMTQPYGGMVIPIESSISFGPSFGEQVEIGTVPSEEAVAKGWAEVEKVFMKAKEAVPA
jgi:DNA polymerase I-like protein with 3'-5' exonuclease and polymerase domains/5'-3' exonuclease